MPAYLYVEAYDGKGRQIFGNLDGQIAWHGRNYRKAPWYRGLSTFRTLNNRVAEYRIVTELGRELERVRNRTHRSH